MLSKGLSIVQHAYMGTEGGKANAILSRQRSLDKYYQDPSYCLECEKIIEVQDGQRATEVRKKRFCNRKCSAAYNNKKFPKRKTKELNKQIITSRKCNKCKDCKEPIKRQSVYCISCWRCRGVSSKTKGELFSNRKNWQSAASSIRKEARKIFAKSLKDKSCVICGYDNHVQISHVRSVSDFDDNTTISEINSIDNLVALCPNHHWELDHGFLAKDKLK